jgi:hypothetical protein
MGKISPLWYVGKMVIIVAVDIVNTVRSGNMYKPVFIIDIRRKVYYLAWYDGLAEMRKVANDKYIIAVKNLPGKFILDGGYRMGMYSFTL